MQENNNKTLEEKVLNELYELNNWSNINSPREEKEEFISGLDVSNLLGEDKSGVTITSIITAVIEDSKLERKINVVSNFDDVNKMAKFFQDMGLI